MTLHDVVHVLHQLHSWGVPQFIVAVAFVALAYGKGLEDGHADGYYEGRRDGFFRVFDMFEGNNFSIDDEPLPWEYMELDDVR